MPGVCPHLVDRHYKSAKRRHSFEDISQSRGNVVRDNAPDIARRPPYASPADVCEYLCAATRGMVCNDVHRVALRIKRSSTGSPATSRTSVLATLLDEGNEAP